ncbi:MAG: flagellar hook-length control protein FliK [Lachnospiraceae bacterium]|nr:flagellar hook-length control protein FliK [Lachnospiraceae bacterium]
MSVNISVYQNPYQQSGSVNAGENIRGADNNPSQLVLTKNTIEVKAGDVFSGQIVGMGKDGMVEILLDGKGTINAKLFQDIPLALGQMMSFQVRTSGKQVALTPLYANLDGNSAEAKALDAAGLPRTPENIEMVDAMMSEGMPIGSDALLSMAKLMNSISSGSPTSVVQMAKLGLPVNNESVEEFEAYKNEQHQIADGVESLSDGFAELASSSGKLAGEVLDIFMGEVPEEVKTALKEERIAEEAEAQKETEGETGAEEAEGTPEKETVRTEEALQGRAPETLEGEAAGKENVSLSPEKTGLKEEVTGRVTEDVTRLLGEDGVKNLADLMKEAGLPKSIYEGVMEGKLSASESLQFIRAALNEEDLPEETKAGLKNLSGSKEFHSLMKNEILNQFLLDPKDVSDKENVRKYYEKLSEDSKKLLNLLSENGRGETALAKGVTNLKQNIDFMNELNQVMTYVQLPLKMNEKNAHGDLYVYTNKKNLAKKDGSVSALLHLDMTHLGTMDVHVAMNNGSFVQTHFIMQKEEMLDFIAPHLPELDEALNSRGYSVKSDVSLNREAKSVPEIMFSQGTNQKLIQKTAFDVRA